MRMRRRRRRRRCTGRRTIVCGADWRSAALYRIISEPSEFITVYSYR
jgi:hypothetical protein